MPVDWTEQTYNAMYRNPWGLDGKLLPTPLVGYTRASQVDRYPDKFPRRWSQLTTLFPIQTTDRILIAGSGFGFLIEAAHAAGFPNVWGIDNSDYISTNRATEAVGSVLFVENDIRGGGQVRAQLRNLTGDDIFDWVISESVIESYTDAELPALLNAAETVLAGTDESQIIHLIVDAPGLDPPLVSRTLAEANALRPAHSWCSLIDWTVL